MQGVCLRLICGKSQRDGLHQHRATNFVWVLVMMTLKHAALHLNKASITSLVTVVNVPQTTTIASLGGYMNRLIALLTDFGTTDTYVGVMKGVMLNINPDLQF